MGIFHTHSLPFVATFSSAANGSNGTKTKKKSNKTQPRTPKKFVSWAANKSKQWKKFSL